MAATNTKLTVAVEDYFAGLRRVRASGSATGERSAYGPLANLLNAVGSTLKPKVFCVGELADLGAGHPDFGLFTAKQVQKGRPREGQTPERGVVEVKPSGEDMDAPGVRDQVSRYWGRYRLVLATNLREFALVGEDTSGGEATLESFRLADSDETFSRKLEKPRAFAAEVGAGLGEYLARALSHRAALAEPKDLAWLLASYARDGLARVEAAGDAPSLTSVRAALEEALGVRFEGDKGTRFFRSTLVQTLCLRRLLRLGSVGAADAGAGGRIRLAHRCLAPARPGAEGAVPAAFRPRQAATAQSRRGAGLGPQPRWTVLTEKPSSPASARARRFPTSTNPSWKPSIPTCASNSASGTRRRKWSATWSPAWTRRSRTTSASPKGWPRRHVYVLDPCCGTGAYLAEVLRRIAANLEGQGLGALTGARVKQAATQRVFGFEIMPAPFVVAHLQVGLTMQALDAPLADDETERAGVFLTNALTGWEPHTTKPLPFPELEEERDRAERVKRDTPILVILGNPPYNGFAGVAVDEEQVFLDAYRTAKQVPMPDSRALHDLYVRFFRMAERRIAEETGCGVVCFISELLVA